MDWPIVRAPANDQRPAIVKFLTRPLERDQVAQAYALIQSADPSVSLDRWTRFAQRLLSARHAGIMTIQTEAGYMCGLFAYEIFEDLRLNRTLAIRHVVAVSLVQPEAIAQALLEAAESLAHLNGCAALTALFDEEFGGTSPDWFAAQLAGNGFRRNAILSAKTIGSGSQKRPGKKA